MTTIAYRSSVIAADGRATNENGWLLSDNHNKVRRLADGRIVAAVGERCVTEQFIKWLEHSDGLRPNLNGIGQVICLDPSGQLRLFEGGGDYTLDPSSYWAWGSGWPVAMGAMHMGATAEQAVRVAAKVDPSTGGNITALEIQGVVKG